jgi:hypothetical protein
MWPAELWCISKVARKIIWVGHPWSRWNRTLRCWVDNRESKGFWRWCTTESLGFVFGFVHRPEFQVTRKHNASWTGSVHVFGWGEGDTYSVGFLGKSEYQSLGLVIQFPKRCDFQLFRIPDDVSKPISPASPKNSSAFLTTQRPTETVLWS